MGKALTIQARREPGYVVVTVAGEVDIATVAALRERLSALAAGGLPLVADLDQVKLHRRDRARGPGQPRPAWRRPAG